MKSRKQEIYKEIEKLNNIPIEIEPEFFTNTMQGKIEVFTHHIDDLEAIKDFVKHRYKSRVNQVLKDSKDKIEILEQELKQLLL